MPRPRTTSSSSRKATECSWTPSRRSTSAASSSIIPRRCRAPASPSRIRTQRAAAAAAAPSRRNVGTRMTQPVAGAHEDVGAGYGARERTAIRGLSHVSSGHATSLERIETLVVEAHEDIARLVAKRIATLIEERRSEEHTSELQSPDHLVCRLLLEKKKKEKQRQTPC